MVSYDEQVVHHCWSILSMFQQRSTELWQEYVENANS